MTDTIFTSLLWGVPSLFGLVLLIYVLKLRRIVPTNVVHIVQRGNTTTSYGVNKTSNVYYEWPGWLPRFGVTVRELPVSNFDIELEKYEAYDKDRVPFVVDVKAFFRIGDTNVAAEKVENYEELKGQLKNVVQGAVRSILAKSKLEEIMEERSVFGKQFTEAVNADLKNWGVEAIKSIELMDVRDADGSNVIRQIMAKRMSAIDKESRVEVAQNNRAAEEAELEAAKNIAVKRAKTQEESGKADALSQQNIGVAKAKSLEVAGIAEQNSLMKIAEARKTTAEKDMEVVRVNQVEQSKINKESEEIDAAKNREVIKINSDANKYQVEVDASAELEADKKRAEGIQIKGQAEATVIAAKGESEALALEKEQLASVTAQTTLAKEIGENKGYQDFLIREKVVKKDEIVEVAQAEAYGKALEKADLKILANSGDVQSGMNKFTDILSSKGGTQINGMIESLKQTDEGKALFDMLKNKMGFDLGDLGSGDTPSNS